MNKQLSPSKNITCERCKYEHAEYECKFCRPINTFCNKCDIFIHNLPSKKNHKRDLIIKFNKEEDTYTYSNKLNSEKNEILEDKIQNLNQKRFLCSHCDKCHNCNSSNLFTKEYVNELKNIFQKEKEEILFKNNSLQNNLDRIKSSFNEQIKSLYKEKDSEIFELNSLVNKLKDINEEILKKLNLKTRECKEVKLTYNKLNNEWQDRFDETIEDYDNKIKNLKNNLIEIEKESLDFEEENESLKISLKEVEKEISKLEKVKSGDEIYLNKAIHKLRADNESLRENLEQNKSENSFLKNEIDNIRNSILSSKTEMKQMTIENGTLKKEIFNKNEIISASEMKLFRLNDELEQLRNYNDRLIINKNY